MPKKPQHQIRFDRIQAAMNPLVGLPQFDDFMKVIDELKEEAVHFSVSFESVASERQSLVCKGEIRTLLNILDIYKSQKEQLKQQTQME